ncbi:helix-turn-helix domain-containing protein [Microbacterium esteraromaticum]|uniref:AraC family transcriptional regulator n=1 Tax=Microbacterium esteraromaticum TaxID=57043 RepID=UPI001A8D59F8|nr:AraC family transcriptional regulator [Microbacterium esteraromaticum]MBN8425311.1 helix-turn-helix domain-containing protein [Microbacterium esteraromaticum]
MPSSPRTLPSPASAPSGTPLNIPPVRVAERTHRDGSMAFWQVRGRSDLIVAQHAYSLIAGQLLWIPASVPHSLAVDADSVVLPLFFGTDESATTLTSTTRITVDRDLRTLLLAYVQTEMSIIQPNVNIARQILAILEQGADAPLETPMPPSGPAAEAAAILRFNPGDDRTLAQLAAAVHSSVRSLERGFLTQTGLTFRQWRISVRMERARQLLRSGASMSAVAHRVGYGDATAFRRAFTAHCGLTPSAFVARLREDE